MQHDISGDHEFRSAVMIAGAVPQQQDEVPGDIFWPKVVQKNLGSIPLSGRRHESDRRKFRLSG